MALPAVMACNAIAGLDADYRAGDGLPATQAGDAMSDAPSNVMGDVRDATIDTVSDATTDAVSDATIDTVSDATADAVSDAPADAVSDATTDAPAGRFCPRSNVEFCADFEDGLVNGWSTHTAPASGALLKWSTASNPSGSVALIDIPSKSFATTAEDWLGYTFGTFPNRVTLAMDVKVDAIAAGQSFSLMALDIPNDPTGLTVYLNMNGSAIELGEYVPSTGSALSTPLGTTAPFGSPHHVEVTVVLGPPNRISARFDGTTIVAERNMTYRSSDNLKAVAPLVASFGVYFIKSFAGPIKIGIDNVTIDW